MAEVDPVAAPQSLAEPPQDPKPQRRKWLWLGLALIPLCCCSGPFAWLAITGLGGRQVAILHDRLAPGMSVAEVLSRVDHVRVSNYGLYRVFAFPRAAESPARSTDGSEGCPNEMLIWSPSGPPWGRGQVPPAEVAARKLAACDRIEFRLVVLFSRFEFQVKLTEGRISEVTPLQGQYD